MKVKDLIKALRECNQDREITLSSDEEMNTEFRTIEIGDIADTYYTIYGLSGSELDKHD